MVKKIHSCAVLGLECKPVEVEVDISMGQSQFNIVGLPDTSIQESRVRIYSALKNIEFPFPTTKRLVINLAPADIRKEGPSYDLPMTVGIILSTANFEINTDDSLFVGELSLEGKLRHTNGILPIAIYGKENGFKKLYLPAINAPEASLIKGIDIIPVKDLTQLLRHLSGEEKIAPAKSDLFDNISKITNYEIDMAHIKGQENVKRALEIASAGAHNILMSGPPGSGKTLLSRAMPSILPKMEEKEILEVTKIYSVSGLLPNNKPLVTERPFRTPHHTSSGVALVGGGKIPKPGEISLAHRGVLFLDEFPEFPRQVLENLRQPLEDGVVTVSRVHGTHTFPANFILVASQNPCPCGYYGDQERHCVCSQQQVMKYKNKISGPLLDRIDLHIEVPSVKFEKLSSEQSGESSENIRIRVEKAREIQKKRLYERKIITNSEMNPNQVKEFCKINDQCIDLLRNAVTQMHLSARSYYRILKLARTIADLGECEGIETSHIAEALQYRQKE
ncbi:YifB family Mg chelatase-like AAA ATPase [Patescibacteria group bacterium]